MQRPTRGLEYLRDTHAALTTDVAMSISEALQYIGDLERRADEIDVDRDRVEERSDELLEEVDSLQAEVSNLQLLLASATMQLGWAQLRAPAGVQVSEEMQTTLQNALASVVLVSNPEDDA